MNTIPRLVGDVLEPANKIKTETEDDKEVVVNRPEIRADKQALLVVTNYTSLDNNREIKRIFPGEIPSWIKHIVVADRSPQSTDVYAIDPRTEDPMKHIPSGGTSDSSLGDPFPVGTVWVCRSVDTNGNPKRLPWLCGHRSMGMPEESRTWPYIQMFILGYTTAYMDDTDVNTSTQQTAHWVPIQSPTIEAEPHHTSEIRAFPEVTDLYLAGMASDDTEPDQKDAQANQRGWKEMHMFVPDASVCYYDLRSESGAKRTFIYKSDSKKGRPPQPWMVDTFVSYAPDGGDGSFKSRAWMQTARMLRFPYLQLHRSWYQSDVSTSAGAIKTSWMTDLPSAELPVGSIIMWPMAAEVPKNWLLCDGSQYSGLFDDLSRVLLNYYGSDIGGSYSKLPDFQDRYPVGLRKIPPPGLQPGEKYQYEAGLPKILGRFDAINHGNGWGPCGSMRGDGAFYPKSYYSSGIAHGNPDSDWGVSFAFDASRSNSIYGKSDTVRPNSTVVKFIIKSRTIAQQAETLRLLTTVDAESKLNDNGTPK